MQRWKTCAAQPLCAQSLAALFANELPAIRIPQFATAAECAAFAAAAKQFAMRPVKGDTAHGAASFDTQQIMHLGMTQASYKRRGVQAYFDDAVIARAETARVIERSFDPVARLIALLDGNVEGTVDTAREPDGSRYFAGIIRNANNGLALHADFAPYQAPLFAVSAVDTQLAWNFYAETPAEGGVTTLHNAPWTWTRSSPGEVAENYPLDASLVAGAQTWSYQPSAGEAVLFNTRNPHVVTPVVANGCDRLAMAAFVGRLPDGELVVWS